MFGFALPVTVKISCFLPSSQPKLDQSMEKAEQLRTHSVKMYRKLSAAQPLKCISHCIYKGQDGPETSRTRLINTIDLVTTLYKLCVRRVGEYGYNSAPVGHYVHSISTTS
eukprot:6213485-Pleurochrysis_carterae.AAC.4